MALDDYTAPCALVDERGDILLVAGLLGGLLKLPSGPLASNLLEIVPASLRAEVRVALRAAAATRRKVVRPDVSVEVGDETRQVRVIVRPLPGLDPEAGVFAVIFREHAPRDAGAEDTPEARSEEPALEQLESDLRATRAQLKSTIEDLESANEQLKSSNEELLASNEELQTSQEELQSPNEELETVNDELKHKLDELGTAHSDLSNLFESTAIATIFLDLDLRIAKFTPAATALFRLLGSDLGRHLSDLAPRFVGQNLVTDAREVLRTLEPHERQARSADGRRWFVLRVTPYRTIDGTVAGVVVTFVDVTELRRAEEVERRYGKLLDSSHDAIFIWRLGGEIETWNRGAEALYGFRAEQAIGQPPQRLLQTEAAEPWADVEAALRERGRWDGDLVHRASDGRRVVVSARLQLSVSEDGVGTVLESNRDITARTRAEAELERSRKGLRQLAAASLRVVKETGREAVLEVLSVAARELTGARVAVSGHGYASGELLVLGAAPAPASPPGQAELLEHAGVYMKVLEGVDAIRLTVEQMRADPRFRGHVPSRGVLGVRLLDQKGRPNGMILATDKDPGDFTEEDEALLLQLGALASVATQHVEARLSLEEADQNKTRFIAMLSHELRNPLGPICNGLYILDRAAPGSEQAKRARGIVERQVAHLGRLVDDLLDVTRISHAKIQLRRERLDLGDVVRHVIEDHRAAFVKGGIALREAISDRRLPLDGDRTRIAQAVGNLLQNAAKFTEPGGTVTVEVHEALRQGVVRVRDTGPGIAKDVLRRLFEPFTQADVTLDRTKVPPGGPARDPSQPVRPRRVLLIEDHADAAEGLRGMLELHGHTVEVADSGAAGLDKARAWRPDAVLCDIGLPGMDGYEVARALRADPALRGLLLVAVTGYAGPEDVARSRQAGFDAHLAKPTTLEQIEHLLEALPATSG
jgi:two-component system CheB/CheR fusion protein